MQKMFFVMIFALLSAIFPHPNYAHAEFEDLLPKQEVQLSEEEILSKELTEDEGDSVVEIASESQPGLSAIDLIEIGVISREIRVTQITENGPLSKIYPAATASPKNTRDLPFDRKGEVKKIVYNPSWTPTKNIRKENVAKFGKKLPKVVKPGKNNPLGKVKIFIAYENGPNDLGIHHTNEPKSIGKRVSHGCNRMHEEDSLELAALILGQNGYDADEIEERARKNPTKSIVIKISNGPEVYYRKM